MGSRVFKVYLHLFLLIFIGGKISRVYLGKGRNTEKAKESDKHGQRQKYVGES